MTVTFEPTPGRLKVVLPKTVNWLTAGLFSLLLVIWLAMVIVVAVFLLGGQLQDFIRLVLIIIWLVIWLWFGRTLWARWQSVIANREILIIDGDQLILRRPVSLLGTTRAYDLSHVSPFYFSERHGCPTFDYAYLHVYFGRSLDEEEARYVVDELNRRYFPHAVDADEAQP
jgi:hypothetical protein